MALMMVFSKHRQEQIKEKAISLGFEYYQTDNIYRFMRYAGEARPDIVMMQFEDGFNTDADMMCELKRRLCRDNVCPHIYLNKPEGFIGEEFFYHTDINNTPQILRALENVKQTLQ